MGLLERFTGTLSLPRQVSAASLALSAGTLPISHRFASDMLYVSTLPKLLLLSRSPGSVKYRPAQMHSKTFPSACPSAPLPHQAALCNMGRLYISAGVDHCWHASQGNKPSLLCRSGFLSL